MRFFLEESNGGIYLYSLGRNGKKSYVDSMSKYNEIINYICSSSFQILTDYHDLLLRGRNDSFEFHVKDYETVFRNPECAKLIKHVDFVYERNGAVDLSQRKNISKTHSHKSKYAGSRVKKIALTLPIVISLVLGTSFGLDSVKADERNTSIKPDHEIVMEDSSYNIADSPIQQMIVDENAFEEIAIEDNTPLVQVEYEDLSDTQKALECKDKYFDIISKYASKYGVDPNIMLGIASQERGVHSREIDSGGGCGLMQVQYSVWAGHILNTHAFNKDTGKFEDAKIKITDEKIRDLEGNIEIACAIFQNCLNNSKYNIPMAIQMYNQGYGSIHDLVTKFAKEKGISNSEVCDNVDDISWMKYTKNYAGDPKYLNHVLGWIADNSNFSVTNYKTLDNISVNFESTLNRSR